MLKFSDDLGDSWSEGKVIMDSQESGAIAKVRSITLLGSSGDVAGPRGGIVGLTGVRGGLVSFDRYVCHENIPFPTNGGMSSNAAGHHADGLPDNIFLPVNYTGYS